MAAGLLDSYHRGALRGAMSRHVGVLRTPDGLRQAREILATLARNVSAGVEPTRRAFEATNMLTIASAVVAAAMARTESRGCHRRTDFAGPQQEWERHLTAELVAGEMEVR